MLTYLILGLSLSSYPISTLGGECDEISRELYPIEHRNCIRMLSVGEDGCYECVYSENERSNPWVDAMSIIAPAASMLGSAYFGYKSQKRWADSYSDTNQYWSDAYKAGQTACNGRLSGYQGYLEQRGANPMSPEQFQGLMGQCNGVGMGAFAGMGGMYGNGFGGVGNPFISAGYSPGFMSGMMGPHFGPGNMYGPGNAGININGGINLGRMFGPGNGGGININLGGINLGSGGMLRPRQYVRPRRRYLRPGRQYVRPGRQYVRPGWRQFSVPEEFLLGVESTLEFPVAWMHLRPGRPVFTAPVAAASTAGGGGIYARAAAVFTAPGSGGVGPGWQGGPWGGGGHWGNTGGWNTGVNTNAHLQYQQQQQQQMLAYGAHNRRARSNQITRQRAAQGFMTDAARSQQNLYSLYGAGYGAGQMYGHAPYAAGNLGLQFSAGVGMNTGWMF